jgi:glycosyltransferase involved in cell wall biosynthesis
MRIALVTETYFPQINGVSRTLGELVRVLRDAGDDVLIIHPDYGENLEDPHRHVVRSFVMPFYKELFLPVPPFWRTQGAISRFKPDLVHIATEATLGLSILRWTRRRRIPTVSSFHTNFDQYSAHYRIGALSGTIWRYLRWFHNRTLETYVPSNATIADLKARGFKNLVLWPRGVNTQLFSPDRPGRARVRAACGFKPQDIVVGYVSRIAAEKNVAYLAHALQRAAQANPRLRILIVGDGPARPDLEKQLGPNAVFAGYRTGEDLADHYAACDLFAFTSLTETFGNVILEAMASGLPVAALRAGGPGDTIRDGITGFLLDPADPPALFASRLLELVEDHAARRSMSLAARAYAESQSWDAIMSTLRERYLKILSGTGTVSEPADDDE